ncbi:MAG: hypothetical protein VYA86_06765 [Candidatus Thermoplasmatota archaeon]|nr:hypothetical protein [Candidatus Thermoplasmatota archaeon]
MGEEDSPRSRFRNLKSVHQPEQTYQPGFSVMKSGVVAEQSTDAQFGMIISLGGGVIALLLGIWTFMVSETDSDWTFLWLAIGSLLATTMSFVLVEIQHRRQGILSIIHDYILAFGLLFGVLCTYWLSRFSLYLLCAYGAESTAICQGESGSVDWIPGGWGVVVQSTIVGFAILVLWNYTKRVNGGTVPRLVMVLAPLAVMVVGATIWVDYASNTSTLPILIAVITMSTIAMAVATDSDRSPLFLTAAIACSLTPFLYEIYLYDLTGLSGEGISMLIIIVLIQGVFAAHPGLSTRMIEKGSVALVLLVIIAQWVAGESDAELIILEPIQHEWISLQLMLWISLLVGYFWPVHQNRVPSMPIGLGFALLLIPSPGSMLAWCLGLLAFIYMLTKPQTRRWVSDWTFIGMMFSWFVGGWSQIEDLVLDPFFLAIPPLALITIGHFAMREGKLANSALTAGILMVLLSNELLTGDDPYLPIGVAIFLLALVWQEVREAKQTIEAGYDARMDATGWVALAAIGILILELANRLTLPQLSHIDIQIEAMFFAVTLYILGRGLRDVEVDLGQLIANVTAGSILVPEYDASTRSWISKRSESLSEFKIGPAARIGLCAPLLLFSMGLARSGDLANQLEIGALLLIPIGILTYEVVNELPNDDRTRATAAWLLFLIGLPISLYLHLEGPGTAGNGNLLFDTILLGGPLIVEIALRKRGLEGEKDMVAGSITLLGVLAIASLDTTGGLLAIPLFALVLIRGFNHRQGLAIGVLGFAWVIWVWMLELENGELHLILDAVATLPDYFIEKPNFDLPRWSGIGLLLIGTPSLLGWANDRRLIAKGEEVDEFPHPYLMPTLFVLLGAFLIIPEPHWFLLCGVLAVSVVAWSSGTMSWFYASSILLFIQLANVGVNEWNMSEIEMYRFAGTYTFVYNASLYMLHLKGRLFQNTTDDWNEGSRQNLVDVIVSGGIIAAVIADTYYYGIALLLGIILFTQYAHKRRWANILLMIPVAHGWVVGRLLADPLPDFNVEISGFVMLIESIALTWASWQMWDFEWTEWSDEQVVEFSNNSGVAGALIFIPAAWLLVIDSGGEWWLFGGMLCVHSAGQGALGFQRDIPWRRLYSMIGVSIGFLCIWGDIESGIMKGVMLILAALTLFMLGILYMTRAGFEMKGTGSDADLPTPPPQHQEDSSDLVIPEPVNEDDSDEEEEDPDVETEVEENTEFVPAPTYSPIINDRFDVQLPMDVRHNIESTLDTTDYTGFRPVVKWDSWGQVVLDWQALEEE